MHGNGTGQCTFPELLSVVVDHIRSHESPALDLCSFPTVLRIDIRLALGRYGWPTLLSITLVIRPGILAQLGCLAVTFGNGPFRIPAHSSPSAQTEVAYNILDATG